MTGDLTEFASGIEFSKCKQVNLRDYLKLSKKIKTCLGDVIMARYATIGTVSYVDIDSDFLVSYSCVTIKPNPSKVLGLYLYYYFKSNSFLQGIQYQVNTNTQGNVGINDLSKMKIVLPSIKEQEEIIAHLQMNLEQLVDLSTKSTQAINLIQERRTALISAAVTGKIDVRDWVAPDTQDVEEPQEATA
ncbi:restriction endonuclease subunit S [Cronobacter dublinensis]